nr:PREDICTED: uncharacterized protein LOC100879352 isoform X2 [Megachile rotundata]
MAASRVDSRIGDTRLSIPGNHRSRELEFRGSSDEEATINKENEANYLTDEDNEGRYKCMVHDCSDQKKSLFDPDKEEFADRRETSPREIKDPKSSQNEARNFQSIDRVQPGVKAIQIKNTESKRGSNETAISTRVIYKLVEAGKHPEDTVRGDQCEASPQIHANLIVDRDDSPEGATSGTEVPRKPADSPTAIKDETASQGGPRSSTPVRKQTKCENCGEPHPIYTERPYLHKYPSYLDGDALEYGVKDGEKGIEFRQETPVASLLYRSKSLPRLSMHDSGVACSGNEQVHAAAAPHAKQLVADLKQLHTLKQHYYPEGGWGWIVVFTGVLVQVLSHGIHGSNGIILQQVAYKFGNHVYLESGWLGAMSTGVALLVSPVTIAFCRRKSTRLTAVLGGLVTALGCLFTSFASQFHQLFFSYGTVVGIGVGMTRDCSTLMVAQYFKRRRELVEIFIVSGSGLGIAVMSAFIKGMISKIGWRLGLQAVTGVVFLTFILGTFYRSASLYHPQRRAILHLKNHKRKIKDKNKTDDRPPFFDFSTLKSKTVRILLVSTGISAFGINTPIFYLAHQAEEEGLGDTVVLLQAYLGLAWTLGCVAFGLLVVHRSVECRIARQYLTQAAIFVCGLCILALTAVQGNYHGYVMFAWIYGIFCGGYHYSLKMYTYERVRARNFARTWGFVQCSQAIPIAIGVPISGYMNVSCGGKAGYYFSSTCVLVGGFTLFFIDLHRRNLSRHKHTRSNGTKHLCVSDNCPQRRKLSFSQEPENDGPHVATAGAAAAALVLGTEISPTPGEMIDALAPEKPELTCISEEGIADMDLPDNMLEDLDYIGDCITSCNKVENYLMLSEFENNLIAEMPIIMDRRGRRWSIARSKGGQPAIERPATLQSANEETDSKTKWHVTNVPPNNRVITVIDEASA